MAQILAGILIFTSFPNLKPVCFFYNNWVINAGYPPHTFIGDDGTYCRWTNFFDHFPGNVAPQQGIYWSKYDCPIPKVNPDVRYTYNTNTDRCEREALIIALSGLGGEVMASGTRAAYAEVKTDTGAAKAGAQVSLTHTVVPDDDGQVATAHEGTLLPVAGNTGADGRFNFSFVAPLAGGMHTIKATCTNCTNEATGTIKVPGCPVPRLTSPPFSETCAEVLENLSSTQAQKEAACGALTPELIAGKACFEAKLAALTPAIPVVTTSNIRSLAYQAHLRQIWDRMERVVDWMAKHPTIQTACAARRAEIAAEKGCDNAGRCTSCFVPTANRRSHCLKGRPANPTPNFAQHAQGKAFDVSEDGTINPLLTQLAGRTPPVTVQQFLNAPTNCNLSWGGTFIDNIDLVHFYVP
ncbi:MAG: carboxypeptidase-like regulatory domain-containing protein [Sideroxydans sp.]|nr:carboxypeptidase-like regulatory domain-containing protein [Sideroxydans sp.]